MAHRILTRQETENSIRALAKTIHETADKLTDTERESLVDAVLKTITLNGVQFTKKSSKNRFKRRSKICRSR
jgi:hypothetical protein